MRADEMETPDDMPDDDASPALDEESTDEVAAPEDDAGAPGPTGTILIAPVMGQKSDDEGDPEEPTTPAVTPSRSSGTVLLEPGMARRPDDGPETDTDGKGSSEEGGAEGAATDDSDTTEGSETSDGPESTDAAPPAETPHPSLPPAAVPQAWMFSSGAAGGEPEPSPPPGAGTPSWAQQPAGITAVGGGTPSSPGTGTPSWAQQPGGGSVVPAARKRRSKPLLVTAGVLGLVVVGLVVSVVLVQRGRAADEATEAAAVVDFETGAGIVMDTIDEANDEVATAMGGIGSGVDIDTSGVVTVVDEAIDDLQHLAIPDGDGARQADQQAVVDAVDAEEIFLQALNELAQQPLAEVQAGAAQPTAESWSQVARALERAIPVVPGRQPSATTQAMADTVVSFGQELATGGQQLRENAALRVVLADYRNQVTGVIARYRQHQSDLAGREMRLWNPATRFDDPYAVFEDAADDRRLIAADLDAITPPQGIGSTQTRMAQIVREIANIVEFDPLRDLNAVYVFGGNLGQTASYQSFVQRTEALGDEFNGLEQQLLRQIADADAALG